MRSDKLKLGWFSSARDKAARDLLLEVHRRIKDGFIKAELAFAFLTKIKGESEEGDRFYLLCETLGIKVIWLSSKHFMPELRKEDPIAWRRVYHQEVKKLIRNEGIDLGVLSGYMLVVDGSFVEEFNLLNLHPALPGGPQGSWEEVIWTLIEKKEKDTGAMIHLVTEELDKGPALSYFRLELKGGLFDPLWKEVEKCPRESLRSNPAAQKLFWAIREEEQKRELPLLALTLKAISSREISLEKVKAGGFFPMDLTADVEAYLRGEI